MNALRKLEKGGYQFELNGEQIAYSYHDRQPPPEVWARPLLKAVRTDREAVVTILRARQEWLAVFDAWSSSRVADPARDARYLSRLAELAVLGQLPCYEDGQTDAGPDGWHRLMDRFGLLYPRAAGDPDPT